MSNKYILTLIIIVGLLVRIWGIGFGLPGTYGPSSEGIIIRNALSFGSGNLVPLYSTYGPIASYILLIFYGLYYILGYFYGLFSSTQDFAISYFIDPSIFYLIGRIINAIISSISIYLTYSLCNKLLSKHFSMLTALLFALSYLPIAAGHIIMADNLCVLFNLLIMINLTTFYKTLNINNILVSVFLGILSTLTKYYSILIFIPIIISLFYYYKKNRKNIFIIVSKIFIICLGTLIIFAPYIFFHFNIFIQDILMVLQVNENSNSSFINNIASYIYFLSNGWGFGPVFFILSIVGIAVSIKRMQFQYILLISFPLTFILYLSLNRYVARWLLQILPMFLILCAIGTNYITSYIKNEFQRKLLILVIVFFGFTFIIPDVFHFLFLINKKDTREIAYDWISENIDESSIIILDSHCPPIRSNNISLIKQWEIARTDLKNLSIESDKNLSLTRNKMMKMRLDANKSFSGKKYYIIKLIHDFYQIKDEDGNSISPYRIGGDNYSKFDLAWYKSNGSNYMITSSFIYQRYYEKKQPNRIKGFYNELFDNYELIKEINPNGRNEIVKSKIVSRANIFSFHENSLRPGPIIRIYKLN